MRKQISDQIPLANYVTGAAKAAGLSLDTAANTLGIAASQLSRYLAGRIRMPLNRAAHLAHLLRLTEAQSDHLLILIELTSASPKLRAFVTELERRVARGGRRARKPAKTGESGRSLRILGDESSQAQELSHDADTRSGALTPPLADCPPIPPPSPQLQPSA